jgi:hypothetical protein
VADGGEPFEAVRRRVKEGGRPKDEDRGSRIEAGGWKAESGG